MKFLQQKFPDATGTVKLIPENPDDLWLISNLIAVDDLVTTITSRKVQLSSSGGKVNNSTRVKFLLELKVSSSDLSPSSLRISGKTQTANDHIKQGSFHTLELELNKEFSLMKKVWDSDSKKKLSEFSSNNKIKIGKGSGNKDDDMGAKAMEKFREVLRGDTDRACYGLKSVENAIEMSAIETLLITDELFRCREKDMRKKYNGMVESVKRDGGKAIVISCKELAKLTGIGAILRFPLPNLDDLVL